MSNLKDAKQAPRLGYLAAAVCWAMIALLPTSALAAVVSGLYETVVTPGDKPRDSAFAEAMRQVAVRVSGSREAAERIMAARPAPDPRRYVQQFSFKGDGSAQVSFDSATFDRLLTNAGLPIWPRERPAVLVWLAIQDSAGRTGWQSATDRSPERESIEAVAKARGIPLMWPALDATDLGLSAGLAGGSRSHDQLMSSAERYRADAVLVGTTSSNGSVRWTFAFNGEVVELTSTLEDGMHLAADTCAKLLAVGADVRGAVALHIYGIRDLDAYARTLNYLESLTLVRAVTVQQLQSDELDLVLSVRGDASALRRTIGLSKRLTPRDPQVATQPAALDRLHYEFQP
jgi:hypothetical protein